jgi:hypothetical protein
MSHEGEDLAIPRAQAFQSAERPGPFGTRPGCGFLAFSLRGDLT